MMQGFFGLGVSEAILVFIAIILILGPKNIVLIKPIIKSIYKAWLKYKKEVRTTESEINEMRDQLLGPLKEAEMEAAEEIRRAEITQALSDTKLHPKKLAEGIARNVKSGKPPKKAKKKGR